MLLNFTVARSILAQTCSIIISAFRRHWRYLLLVFAILLALFSLDVYRRERHAFAIFTAAGIKTFSKSPKPLFPPSPEACSAWPKEGVPDPSIACAGFPKHLLSDIQIVIKTGAGDRDKTEAILRTFGACLENPLIVSDAPEHVHGHEVIDIIADLPPSYAENNDDWPFYLAQLEDVAAGEHVAKSAGGWKLDKLKFMPMIDRSYQVAPHAKWHVFIEADIYYFWDTLFRVLSLMDPDEYHYLGTAAPTGEGIWFGYGGAGMILSRALIRDFTKDGTQKLGVKFEDMIRADCCGDVVVAYALLKELGVRIETLYPMFTGEESEWLGASKERWCVPLVGMHRVGPEKMAQLWKWERCQTPSEQPVTFASFLDFTLTPLLEATPKIQWNNGADGIIPPGSPGNESARACELACAARKDCLQWKYSTKDTCRIAGRVNSGRPADDEGLVADWHLEAMELLGYNPTKDPTGYCRKPTWLLPKIM